LDACGGDSVETYAWAHLVAGCLERFWRHVTTSDHPDGCWEWTGAKSRGGGKPNGAWYTTFKINGRIAVRAHIFVCVAEGRMIRGHHVDHTCRNTLCVRPSHLEVVTPLENDRRKWIAVRAAKVMVERRAA